MIVKLKNIQDMNEASISSKRGSYWEFERGVIPMDFYNTCSDEFLYRIHKDGDWSIVIHPLLPFKYVLPSDCLNEIEDAEIPVETNNMCFMSFELDKEKSLANVVKVLYDNE